jgi:hypothetical protein
MVQSARVFLKGPNWSIILFIISYRICSVLNKDQDEIVSIEM